MIAATLLLLASTTVQQSAPLDVARAAQLVHETDQVKLEEGVRLALRSTNPTVRMAGARVATVRNLITAVNRLRIQVDREEDPDAVREGVRALVTLGGLREIDRGLFVSDRFGKRIDSDIAAAASRLGMQAVDPYLSILSQRSPSPLPYFRQALWGSADHLSSVAARLLAAKDDHGFLAVLYLNRGEPRDLIDVNVLLQAIAGEDNEMAAHAIWYAVDRALARNAKGKGAIDPRILTAVANRSIRTEQGDLFVSAELLRRVAGQAPRESPAFKVLIGGNRWISFRLFMGEGKAASLLTETERALWPYEMEDESELERLPFSLPSSLPRGVADAVLRANQCNGEWMGSSRVVVDRVGRVLQSDVANVRTSDGCRRALDTLLKLSLVRNRSITSPLESTIPLVHSRKAPSCFDEAPVGLAAEYMFGALSFRGPRLRTHVRPDWPPGVERTKADVKVEVVVSETGCVRTSRLIGKPDHPALAETALFVVTQWTFEPARFITDAIESTVPVTVQFRP